METKYNYIDKLFIYMTILIITLVVTNGLAKPIIIWLIGQNYNSIGEMESSIIKFVYAILAGMVTWKLTGLTVSDLPTIADAIAKLKPDVSIKQEDKK